MSGLFSLDDVKLLYAASQIKDGDDEKKSASLVPKMQMNLFSKSKDPKGHTEEEEEEEEDGSRQSSGESESSEEEVEPEQEGEESDDLLDDLGDAADKLAQAMTDQFFPKQFKVKIQNLRRQNLERRKRDVLIQFQVGVPAERAQEGGLFEEELVAEHDEAEEEGKKGKRQSKPEASTAKAVRTFGTEVVEKLERGRTNVFKKRFSSVWSGAPLPHPFHRLPTRPFRRRPPAAAAAEPAPLSPACAGGYALLPEKALAVVLVERNRFGGSAELDRVQLNLEHLAGGSIQQEVTWLGLGLGLGLGQLNLEHLAGGSIQ